MSRRARFRFQILQLPSIIRIPAQPQSARVTTAELPGRAILPSFRAVPIECGFWRPITSEFSIIIRLTMAILALSQTRRGRPCGRSRSTRTVRCLRGQSQLQNQRFTLAPFALPPLVRAQNRLAGDFISAIIDPTEVAHLTWMKQEGGTGAISIRYQQIQSTPPSKKQPRKK